MRCRAHSLDAKDRGDHYTNCYHHSQHYHAKCVQSLFFHFCFPLLFSGKTVFFFLEQKKAQFPSIFGRSSITSSHSETRIPIAFFCMPDLRALPLRFTCICLVHTLSVSSEHFSQNACKYSLLLLVKIGKPKIAEHVLLYIFICYLS